MLLLAVSSLAVAGDLITGVRERSDSMGDASADLKLSTDIGETGGFDERRELARSGVPESCRVTREGGAGQGEGGLACDTLRAMICIARHNGRSTTII